MEEWKEYRLGDVCSQLSDGLHKAPKFKLGGDYIFVNAKNISNGFIVDNDLTKKSTHEEYLKYSSPLDDTSILYSIDGTIGNVALYRGEKVILGKGACYLNPMPNILDRFFLYYELLSPRFKAYIDKMSTGSTIKHISLKTMRNYSFVAPPLQQQRQIACILSSIDNKITCNRQINDNFAFSFLLLTCFVLWLLKLRNDNLEKQAQALFKSWFVDFEPFMDGEFVESEMGMIPKGWRVGVYDDIILETISGDWGKEKAEGNYTHKVACIRGCDFQDIKNGLRGKTPERFILEKNFQNKYFCDKDMLVEISGGTATVSTGRVCPVSQQLIDKYNGDVVCTNFCKLVRPKKGYGAYLYYSWFNKYNNKVMFGYENGTSGIKNFRIIDFTSIEPVVLPPLEKIQEFQNVIDSIQKQIQTRGTESQNLAQLRDTLLPRLMSGELKVNEIEMH